MLETVPGTNQYKVKMVTYLALGNNGAFDGARTHNLHITSQTTKGDTTVQCG